MLSLASLWMPIVLSAVLVFIASSLIHMVFQWHKREYGKLPNEDAVREVIRQAQLPAGQYVMPFCGSSKDMQQAETAQKFTEGPVATLIMRPSGMPRIGASLGQWFALTLAISLLAAALATTVLGQGADPRKVFHFFAVISFMSYASGSVINAIWMGKLWAAVAMDALDALIYALLTAAAFAWLWPQ